MQKKAFLVILALVLAASLVFAAEYHGKLSVDVGDASIVISPKEAICGDNQVNQAWEQCDGSDLRGATCKSLGYDSGTLACSDCVFDTSNCQTSQPPSGGGGSTVSGGGGDSKSATTKTSACVENWNCTAWTDCKDEKQTRDCTDLNGCGTTRLKPMTIKTCSVEQAELTLKTLSSQENGNFLGGITGAVIGALGPTGTIGVLIFIIGIVAILIFAVIMKKKENAQRIKARSKT